MLHLPLYPRGNSLSSDSKVFFVSAIKLLNSSELYCVTRDREF